MRLIDADALFEFAITEEGAEILDHSVFKILLLRRILDKAPTIEAEPVRHGEWLPIYQTLYNKHGASQIATEWSCSQCGCLLTDRRNYCPNCGAKMDGKEKME